MPDPDIESALDSDGPHLLVLEHTPGAGLSGFAEVLEGRTDLVAPRSIDVPAGEPLPTDLAGVAGVIVLGGSMSAVDPAAHPWMAAELDLLRRAVDTEVPVLGVCLGAQLLGAALGGQVERRERPRMSYLPLRRTDGAATEPVTRGWPDGGYALFVHEDHVARLPDGAVPLLEVDGPARDGAEHDGDGGDAAWRLGSAVAVQFHPEVTGEQLTDWLERGLLGDMAARAGIDTAALAEEAARRTRFTVPLGRALVGRFVDGPVRERLAT